MVNKDYQSRYESMTKKFGGIEKFEQAYLQLPNGKEELEKNSSFEITHLHLNDETVAGMRMKDKKCFSVQYHPEASPGPHDSSYLFDEFIENIKSSLS